MSNRMPVDPDPGACGASQLPLDLTQSPRSRPQPCALRCSSDAAGCLSSPEATAPAIPVMPPGSKAMASSRPAHARACLPSHHRRRGQIASVPVSFALRHRSPGRHAATSHATPLRLAPATPDHRDADHFAPAFTFTSASGVYFETPLRGSRRARRDSLPAQKHLRRPRRVLRRHIPSATQRPEEMS